MAIRFVSTAEGELYALVPVGDHVETMPLLGRGLGAILRGRFYEEEDKAANAAAVADALGVLEMRALQGERITVSVRVASVSVGVVYLDLGGPDWTVVEVTGTGWHVIRGADAPVFFRRPGGLLELPVPERGGSLEELQPFVNVGTEAHFVLLCGWLVAALRGRGPYPVLLLQGEQGSAKSTTARVLRQILDPAKCGLRAAPRKEHDLAIGACNGWVQAFDNLSGVEDWLSDAFCRLATGGGFGTRKLYSDQEEQLFDFERPLLLTGIGDLVSRPDLLDRAIIVSLPRLDDGKVRRKSGLWRDFSEAHPRLLGALFDAVVMALHNEDETAARIGHELPRMADACCWVEAAAPALGWSPGEFLAAYAANRGDANALALEGSPITAPLLEILNARPEGVDLTASELLEELNGKVPETQRRSRAWPGSGRALSGALTRLAPNLRASGIRVEHGREAGTGRRLWTLAIAGTGRDHRHNGHDRHNGDEAGSDASWGRPLVTVVTT